MEKYRRVRAAREPLGSDEIRVTATGRVMNYVSYAGTLITDQKMRQLTIKASGNAIGQAIALAEQLKRRYKGLHQLNTCGNTTVSLVYEPLEEGLDEVTEERVVAFLEIKLSFDPLDENNPGYQPPLDEATINEFKPQAAPGPGGKAHQRAGQNVDPKAHPEDVADSAGECVVAGAPATWGQVERERALTEVPARRTPSRLKLRILDSEAEAGAVVVSVEPSEEDTEGHHEEDPGDPVAVVPRRRYAFDADGKCSESRICEERKQNASSFRLVQGWNKIPEAAQSTAQVCVRSFWRGTVYNACNAKNSRVSAF
ncbi:hypothetical protein cyc_04987 [Cyclospora cayetanensis]|uniref:DNA/RNA-binding protein Alba-like domain-containing protein n=1 Tax=Cyclospora cayetanensis TaxID=88456 RepID=A0A1D3CTB0_9EIME|nr:hypothetical protein cyc_04987 [Cyclospora cayetanensis]